MAAVDDVATEAITDVTGKETAKNRTSRACDYSFNILGIPGMSLQSGIPQSFLTSGVPCCGWVRHHTDACHLTTNTIEKADPDVLVRDTEVYTLASC